MYINDVNEKEIENNNDQPKLQWEQQIVVLN